MPEAAELSGVEAIAHTLSGGGGEGKSADAREAFVGDSRS